MRRVGSANIGIEKIFPVETPTVEKVEVVRKGTAGVRQSKLYYIRKKSNKEIEKIYSRTVRREKAKAVAKSK